MRLYLNLDYARVWALLQSRNVVVFDTPEGVTLPIGQTVKQVVDILARYWHCVNPKADAQQRFCNGLHPAIGGAA